MAEMGQCGWDSTTEPAFLVAWKPDHTSGSEESYAFALIFSHE